MADCADQLGHTHLNLTVSVCVDTLLQMCAESGADPRAEVQKFIDAWSEKSVEIIMEEVDGPED